MDAGSHFNCCWITRRKGLLHPNSSWFRLCDDISNAPIPCTCQKSLIFSLVSQFYWIFFLYFVIVIRHSVSNPNVCKENRRILTNKHLHCPPKLIFVLQLRGQPSKSRVWLASETPLGNEFKSGPAVGKMKDDLYFLPTVYRCSNRCQCWVCWKSRFGLFLCCFRKQMTLHRLRLRINVINTNYRHVQTYTCLPGQQRSTWHLKEVLYF